METLARSGNIYSCEGSGRAEKGISEFIFAESVKSYPELRKERVLKMKGWLDGWTDG